MMTTTTNIASNLLWWHANKVSSLCCAHVFVCVCADFSSKNQTEVIITATTTITINMKKNIAVQSKQK